MSQRFAKVFDLLVCFYLAGLVFLYFGLLGQTQNMLALRFWLGSLEIDLCVKQKRTVLCYAKLSNKYLGNVYPKGGTITEMLVSIQDQAAELLPNRAAPCFLGVFVEDTELTTMEFMFARQNGLRDVPNETSKLLFEACKVQVMWCVDRCAVLRRESYVALAAHHTLITATSLYSATSLYCVEVVLNLTVGVNALPPTALVKQALLSRSKPDYTNDATSLCVAPGALRLEDAGIFEAFPNLEKVCILHPQRLPVGVLASLPKLTCLEIQDSTWKDTLILPKLETLVVKRSGNLRNLWDNIGHFRNLKVLVLHSLFTVEACRIEMTSEIGVLAHLVVLKLNNMVTGKIPPEIGLLTNLKVLDLSSNYLCGDLPKEMSGLPQLAYLDLANQQPANPLFNRASFGSFGLVEEFRNYVDF